MDEETQLDISKTMVEIKPLQAFDDKTFQHLTSGYTSNARYVVSTQCAPERFDISLKLAQLDAPYIKHFASDPEELAHYRQFLAQSFSWGAYDQGKLVGLALAEPRWWNRSLWIWEFHVAPEYQRQGIGRRMMDYCALHALQAGLRVLVCETQNTNAPAIAFYQHVGFEFGGIDLSLYTNHDIEDGEVAIFMKRKLE